MALVLWGWVQRLRILGRKQDECATCSVIGPHLLARRVTWFRLYFVPIFPFRIAHGMICETCGAWTGIDWRTMRRGLRERRLPLDRPRPGFAAGPGVADPTTGQVTDPATFFDTVEPNPNGDRWDRYFKAWPAIAVAVVLTAVIGGAILRERSSGVAAELAVGDCFVEPVGAETVKDVQHQPCAGAHDAEVFALLTMSGSTYPTTENFEAFFTNRCLGSVFQDYTGRSFDDLTELDAGYFYPTTEGWDRGDRRMTCYLAATTKGAKLDHSWRSPSP